MLAEIGLLCDRRDFMARFMGTSEETWWQGLEADALARLGRSIRDELHAPLAERMRAEFRTRLVCIQPIAAQASARTSGT